MAPTSPSCCSTKGTKSSCGVRGAGDVILRAMDTDVVAIAGGPRDGCAGLARHGRIARIYPAERWRRVRAAALTTPTDVRNAIGAVRGPSTDPAPVVVTTEDVARKAAPEATVVSHLQTLHAVARPGRWLDAPPNLRLRSPGRRHPRLLPRARAGPSSALTGRGAGPMG